MKRISGVFMILFFLMLAPLAVSGEEGWAESEVTKMMELSGVIAEFPALLETGETDLVSYTTNRVKTEIRYVGYDGSKAVIAVTVRATFKMNFIGFSVKDLPIMGYTLDLRLKPGGMVIAGDPVMTNTPIAIKFVEKVDEERGIIKIIVAPVH